MVLLYQLKHMVGRNYRTNHSKTQNHRKSQQLQVTCWLSRIHLQARAFIKSQPFQQILTFTSTG